MKDFEIQRDFITVEDLEGVEKRLAIEALFDMEDKTYAFLRSPLNKNDLFVMRVEDDEDGQVLTKVKNQKEKEMIFDAYEIAVSANPAE
ncbi:DUF1292 domain-containing protein [Bacillus sp. T3]|uniref:DUF1292 domain-containing protein n=1 Tax=Bacillus sp. T3 TaxID=467262 RepID=UPI002980CBF7|nr:DUF1292 domain-containing protein [Bacillus sp. T3]